jgi:hypothetical protein
MQYQDADRNDMLGEFHNAIVQVVDMTTLSPPEVVVILRIVANSIERLFEVAVKAE